MSNSAAISPNARRWLNTISFAEGTWDARSGQPRYAITFGYRPIGDLSKHPDRVIKSGGYASAAAGAYQFMPGTWAGVQQKLRLPDFGPISQDLGALQLIRARGVNPDKDPITPQTLAKLAPEWASIPTLRGGSYYGQPSKPASTLIKFSQNPKAAAGYTGQVPGYAETATGARRGVPPAPEGASQTDPISAAVGQALLNTIIGDILRGSNSADAYGGSTQPPVPHSNESDVESGSSGLSGEDVQAAVAEALAAQNASFAEAQRARDVQEVAESNMEQQKRMMAALMQQAQASFGTPAPVF